MSPRVLAEGALIFWFHSHDALHENRASVHVKRYAEWVLRHDAENGGRLCKLSNTAA